MDPIQVYVSTIPWSINHGVNPHPECDGYREGLIRVKLLTNASSGREALK